MSLSQRLKQQGLDSDSKGVPAMEGHCGDDEGAQALPRCPLRPCPDTLGSLG